MTLSLPDDYDSLLKEIKARIRTAQTRAGLAVNRELILLYWEIGNDILKRQQVEGWGAKIIGHLARDLKSAFPEIQGLSRTNLFYMRAFAEAWPDEQIVQQVVAQIPWGHNVRLLDKLTGPEARLWYARQTIEQGWSRAILEMQIESQLRERQVPNWKPKPVSCRSRKTMLMVEKMCLLEGAPPRPDSGEPMLLVA